jgi:ribosome biogenesis GTPase / thiamine phosphate phosphatase
MFGRRSGGAEFMDESSGLVKLGWDAFFAERFAPFLAQGREPARVSVQQKGFYDLQSATGELMGELAGKLHHGARGSGDYPVVGDWVAVQRRDDGESAIIHGFLERRTTFARKAPGSRGAPIDQVIAANVDRVFVVMGLDDDFNLRRLERYLVLVSRSGAQAAVVLNKSDLTDRTEELARGTSAAAPGVAVLVTSARAGLGLDPLRDLLPAGATGAFVGSSGVGKSTLINRLLGEERLTTREVRSWDRRGRHTTTHRELILLPGGGLVIDTPGMREIQLPEIGDGVEEAFDDIDELAAQCRFADCKHDREPGCAVLEAVVEGRLEARRLDSYRTLKAEFEGGGRGYSKPLRRR